MTITFFSRFSSFIFAIAIVLVGFSTTKAVDVFLTTNDPTGTSSFNTAGQWDNLAAPSPGNDYFAVSARLRTIKDPNSYTFAGDSLSIIDSTSGGTVSNGWGLMYKSLGDTGVYTVDNLILEAGWVSNVTDNNGLVAGDLFQLDGNITVNPSVAGNATFMPRRGNIRVLSDLSGTGDIDIGNSGISQFSGVTEVSFAGTNSGFSGNVNVAGGFVLEDTGGLTFDIFGSGVNTAVSGNGRATFNGAFSFDLTGASSLPGDSWAIADVATQSFDPTTFSVNGFSKSGSFWTNGTYTFNTGTGVLSVGAPPNEWNVDADGLFSGAGNWTKGFAPGTDDDAWFGTIISQDRSVTIDSNVQLNSIGFANGSADYFLVDDPNNLGNSITLTGDALIRSSNGRHWLQTEVAGTAGLNTAGSGELVLAAGNSFSGGLTADGNLLSIADNNAVPAGNTVASLNGARVRFVGSNNTTFADNGTGLDPNTTATVNGSVTIDATSRLQATDGANVSFTGGVANDNRLEARSGANVTVAGSISGLGRVEAEEGNLTLSGANSYSGQTRVGFERVGGTLTVTNSNALGVADGTTATRTIIGGQQSTSQLVLSGGVSVGNELLTFEGRQTDAVGLSSKGGNNSWAGNIAGITFGTQYNIESADPAGQLTLSGIISAPDTNTRTFVFSGDGDTLISGKLIDLDTDDEGNPDPNLPVNNSDNVLVVKRGAGTLTIGTATGQQNDFWQGDTTIEEGTLAVLSDGASAGELWSSSITVKAGAVFDVSSWSGDAGSQRYNFEADRTLAGGGTIEVGTASLGLFGDNSVTPGDSVGTLQINGAMNINPTIGSGGSLNYELGNQSAIVGGSENDLIDMTGALTTTGGAAVNYTVNVIPVEYALQSDPSGYRLISHSGGSTNFSSASVTLFSPTDPTNQLTTRQIASVTGSTAGEVNLVVTGSAANQTWTGSTDNQWDVAAKANWSGTGSQFFDLDNVTFDQTGGNQNVDVTVDVVPGSVTVTGSGADYRFSGRSISSAAVTVSNNAVAQFDNSVGGNVAVENTGTLAGAGLFRDDVSVATGASLRIGGVGLGATPPSGSVSLVEDLEGYTVATFSGGSTASAYNVPAGPWNTNTGGNTGFVAIENDGDNYLAYGWNAGTRGANRTVPTIADGDSGTYYFQIRTLDSSPNTSFGLSDDPSGALVGSNFEVEVSLTNNGGPALSASNGGVTEELVTGLSANTWYDIWLVVDNLTDTYDVYYATSGNPNDLGSAIKAGSGLGFNNGAASNDLVTFMTLESDNQDRSSHVDNIYSGNLSIGGGPQNMLIQGDLDLASGSTVSFDIGAPSQNDSLSIEGLFSVADGVVLEVSLDGVSAGSLSSGDSWDLFDFDPNSVIGSWDPNDFVLPGGLASGLEWDTSDLLITGVLSVLLPGDFNFDGTVDGLDFLAWQRDPSIGSLADWEANYGAPLSSNTTTVPEPSTGILLIAGVIGLIRRQR